MSVLEPTPVILFDFVSFQSHFVELSFAQVFMNQEKFDMSVCYVLSRYNCIEAVIRIKIGTPKLVSLGTAFFRN